MVLAADSAWPQVCATGPGLVLVPVGSTEQHGPHLPLTTDTDIAEAVAGRVAARLGPQNVLVTPALSFGSSGEHQAFAGTCSIGTEVLHSVVVEVVRSIRTWASRVVLVNAHGGNTFALRTAVAQLVTEGHDVAWAACRTEEHDLHAGRTETSLMLHLRPSAVQMQFADRGSTEPLARILPALMEGRLAEISPNGVLGDPDGASADEGRTLLETMACQIEAEIRINRPDVHGMLAS